MARNLIAQIFFDKKLIKDYEVHEKDKTRGEVVTSNHLGHELFQHSQILARRYAEKVGADYILFDEPFINFYNPSQERFRLIEEDHWAEDYDNILYIDCDAFIYEDAPNIFEVYPQENLRVVRDLNPDIWWLEEYLVNEVGRQKTDKSYFNAGLMLFHSSTLKAMKPLIKYKERFPLLKYGDQSEMNYCVLKYDLPHTIMDQKFNSYNKDAYIGHLYGPQKFNGQFSSEYHLAKAKEQAEEVEAFWERQKSRIDLTDTTFIIPLRVESPDRYRNVITTICYLLNNFETNIIVKEGDTQSVFLKDVLPQLENFVDTSKLKHVFEDTSSSEFHRTRYLNEMLEMVETPVVVNYDCDIILPVDHYVQAQEMLLSGKADVVYPYGFGNYAKMATVNDELVSQFLNEGDISILNTNCKIVNARFGFCQFFKTDVYRAGGGENENFIAYAPEDEERFYRFDKLGFNVQRIDDYVYHLEHARTPNSWYNNPHMKNNFALWETIQKMSKEEMISYYDLKL